MKSVPVKIVSFLGLLVLSAALHAQTDGNSPYKEVKGRIILSQFRTIDNPSTPEGIFLNALLWEINRTEFQKEGEEETVLKKEWEKRQFEKRMAWRNPQSSSCYRFLLSVKVTDNILSVTVSDITYETETSVIKLVKRLPFEKLQPEKKPKHKEYLDEFAALYQAYSKQMIEAVTSNHPPIIGHWTEIKEGTVVKGMTEDECMLAMGKPASIQKQGNKTEWMYDAYTYLFFENGTLTSFIK